MSYTEVVLAQAGEPVDAFDLAGMIADASPALMLAMFIVALLRRWLILPRELDDRDKRVLELEKERDEYKAIAFRTLNLGERATAAVEERLR